MRVYGTSPLYNYVELIFRSKRLFIASIILTTLIVVGMSSMRSGAYNARALVVLSGSKSGQDAEDAAQRGTVKYKLNLLNVVLKDPKFIETAFKDRGLDKGLTEEEFKKFAKEATSAMQYATGENILEISCRWKDARCADIIKAFYGAYSLRVLEMETLQNQSSTNMLKILVDDFRGRVGAIEKRVGKWREDHIDEPVQDPNAAAQEYRSRKNQVEAYKGQLNLIRNQKEEVSRKLQSEPAMVSAEVIRDSKRRDPEFANLIENRDIWNDKLSDERRTHTESHPNVKFVLEKINEINNRIARMEGKATNSKNDNRSMTNVQERVTINPVLVNLQDQMSQLEIQEQGGQGELEKAVTELNQAMKRAKTSPEEIQKFQKMTEDQALFMSIRDNLRAKLQQSDIDAKRDRELRITEMQMIVEPEAIQEEVGKKSIMLFAAGPILGIIIAFAFSLLSETMDHSIRTPTEVEKYLGKPVLAVLPRADIPKGARRAAIGGGGGENRQGISS